jgi:hypothetical protein
MKRVIALLAGLLMAAGVGISVAQPAQAHNVCTGTCNTIVNVSGSINFGVYDYANNVNWSWVLPHGAWSAGSPLYQQDVEGFLTGSSWCSQVWQSNDNYNYGYWGVHRGGPYGAKFVTTYWAYTRVNQFRC